MSSNRTENYKTRSYVTNLGLTVTIVDGMIKGFYFKSNPLVENNTHVKIYFDGNKTMVLYFSNNKEKDSLRLYLANNTYFIIENNYNNKSKPTKKSALEVLNDSFKEKIDTNATSVTFRYTSVIDNMAILTTEQLTYNMVVDSKSRIASSKSAYYRLFKTNDDTR